MIGFSYGMSRADIIVHEGRGLISYVKVSCGGLV